MKLLRHATVDIVITALVFTVVFTNSKVLEIVLAVVTALLLIGRLSVMTNKEMSKKLVKRQVDVPEWFYHLLNGLNTALLAFSQMWLLAIAWGVIWFLSWKTLRIPPSKSAKRAR